MAHERGDVDWAQKERDDRIRELLGHGLSIREIVAESGVSYVRQARQRRDDYIRELRAAEWTQAEIASEVGCSAGTCTGQLTSRCTGTLTDESRPRGSLRR